MPSAGSRQRFHCPLPLASGAGIDLPAAAARHVQVLRLQPGDPITLFNGEGGEFEALVERMGRNDVSVRIGAHDPVEREAARQVHLAVGLTANDRMDWLVEKAAELGAASIQPLALQRSVLKLSGERAARKQQHWEGVAIAACEQCGRNRVPAVHPVLTLDAWLASLRPGAARYLLSPSGQSAASIAADTAVTCLSGPEGGLTRDEERAALERDFLALQLGPRILRAETAPLAALAVFTLGPP